MEVISFDGQHEVWNEYVRTHPKSSNYHQCEWKFIIERSFGHQTRYLLAMEDSTVVGVLPLTLMKSILFGRSVVSLPFLNYGGVLAKNAETEEALVNSACALAREENVKYMELRHFESHGYGLVPKQHKVTMLLSLASDADVQWKIFNPKVRNQIRKAIKSGLEVEIGGEELIGSFYSIFSRNMRDLGTPVYGRVFFDSIVRSFPTRTKIFIVHHLGKPVAAGLGMMFKDTMEVPWAGSLTEYRSFCPNMLLYWEAIQFGIQGGFKIFDFGRSTPGEGTYRFKQQWGAQPVPLVWEYWMPPDRELPDLSPKNPKFHFAINMWKRLPVSLANTFGPIIIKSIP